MIVSVVSTSVSYNQPIVVDVVVVISLDVVVVVVDTGVVCVVVVVTGSVVTTVVVDETSMGSSTISALADSILVHTPKMMVVPNIAAHANNSQFLLINALILQILSFRFCSRFISITNLS